MAKKALLIGINNYESIGDLRGCLNDVTNMRHMLMRYFDFRADDISLLIDRSAVKERIEQRMGWLFSGTKKGDQLVLHFSGHGSYIRDFDGDEKARRLHDNVDELICLYDMDWRARDSFMIDDELGRHLGKAPKGTNLVVVLDCCHSGTGTRDVGLAPPPHLAPPGRRSGGGFDWDAQRELPPAARSRGMGWVWVGSSDGGPVWVGDGDDDGGLDWGRRSGGPRDLGPERLVSQPRFVAPPLDIELRADERRPPPRIRFGRPRGGAKLNHVLLAGCRDDQTSADAYIGGAFNGAFTYYLCKTIREANGRIRTLFLKSAAV